MTHTPAKSEGFPPIEDMCEAKRYTLEQWDKSTGDRGARMCNKAHLAGQRHILSILKSREAEFLKSNEVVKALVEQVDKLIMAAEIADDENNFEEGKRYTYADVQKIFNPVGVCINGLDSILAQYRAAISKGDGG